MYKSKSIIIYVKLFKYAPLALDRLEYIENLYARKMLR